MTKTGMMSDKDIEKYSVLTYPDMVQIYRTTGVSVSTAYKVLRGIGSCTAPKAVIALREADRILKSRMDPSSQEPEQTPSALKTVGDTLREERNPTDYVDKIGQATMVFSSEPSATTESSQSKSEPPHSASDSPNSEESR